MPIRRLQRAQMFYQYIPYRRSALFVDRGPSGYPVALAGLERTAVIELQFGNPSSGRFRRRTGVGHAPDANHIAALLIIGIGIEEIVADIFEDILDLAAGHAEDIGFRIGDG